MGSRGIRLLGGGGGYLLFASIPMPELDSCKLDIIAEGGARGYISSHTKSSLSISVHTLPA